jgi:hypothetical protein
MDWTWNLAGLLVLVLGVVLQLLALRRMSGGWRVAAWVPAFALSAAVAIAVLGVIAGSDLAPIWVVLALPLCLFWLLGLWVIRGLACWLSD